MFNFLIARISASLPRCRSTQLGFFHRDASHIFIPFSSVAKSSESNQSKQKQERNTSFTVSYLVSSLGFSTKEAIELSKRVKLKDSGRPDSVISLFRSYGFSDTQISKIVKVFPPVLSVKPEKNLLPKLTFIHSLGFSGSEIPQLISNYRFLAWSLKTRIIPGYEALKSVLDDDEKVNIALKRSGWNFLHHRLTNLGKNIKVLRELGVPQSSVSLLVASFANVAFMNHAKFVAHVRFAEEMGVDPLNVTFIQAIYVLTIIKKSTWRSRLAIFERCGWSRDVTHSVFAKYPYSMALSEDKITSTFKFLVDEMGLQLEDIASCPSFLGYNLKQRIIPRCSVVKILKMKGLISNHKSLSSIVTLSEKMFLENFVVQFQESVPGLLNIYRGLLEPLPEVQS